MKERYTYYIEKSSILIRKLITGEGNAKQRLRECEVEIMLSLCFKMPDDLEPKRLRVLKRLNQKSEIRNGDNVSVTAFQHSLLNMKNVTAAKIIGEIYDLYDEIEFRYR